jgi:hypothetical protein
VPIPANRNSRLLPISIGPQHSLCSTQFHSVPPRHPSAAAASRTNHHADKRVPPCRQPRAPAPPRRPPEESWCTQRPNRGKSTCGHAWSDWIAARVSKTSLRPSRFRQVGSSGTTSPTGAAGAWPFRLYLRRPAIDKQLDPSHETGIRGPPRPLRAPHSREDRVRNRFGATG